ncbi:MAG: VWA domain-containing protein [Acidobacteria bacterium]|nr:VWA domain-containing protein [Acidobacteriota bacterium]
MSNQAHVPRRSTTRRIALSVAVALVLAGAQAQGTGGQKPIDPQAPVFRSGVELVTVDVTVVDRDGNPVKGLRPGQFEVTLDGKARRVVSAELLEFVTSAKPSGPGPTLPARPLFSSNENPPEPAVPGRLIFIAVDQGSFRTFAAHGAMEAARKFIDRLRPSDRVGLIAFPPPGPLVEASENHSATRAATEKIMGMADPLRSMSGSVQVSLSEAIDIRGSDDFALRNVMARECALLTGSALAQCKQQIMTEAAGIGMAAELQSSRSIGGLQGVIRALAQIRERKILVLVSGGLPVSDRIGGDIQNAGAISTLGREAAAANLSLYVLHMDSTFLDAFSASNGRAAGVDGSLWREMGMMSIGLEIVAGSGGGSLHRVVGGADVAFDRVLRETAAAYVLGVEPAESDRDGKSHRIKVKVNAPGVEVHSRTEVLLPRVAASAATPDDALGEILRARRLATGLPVRVTTHTMAQESGAGLRVFISAEIGEGLSGPVDMHVAYVVTDATGRSSSVIAQKSPLTPRATSRIGSASFFADAVFKPGYYVLRLAAVDPAGRAGSVDHPFTVGLTEGDGVRIGDLLLLDPLRTKEEGVAVVTDGQLWGQSVEAYVEFVPKSGQLAPSSVTFGIADRPGAQPLVSFVVPASKKDPSSPWSAGGHLDLSILPPGDYTAVATITDGTRRLGSIEHPLRIEPRAPVPAVSGGAGALAPRVRFSAGESGSLVRAFARADVLRGEALGFFLSRLRAADASAAGSAAVEAASAALREGKFDEALSALAGADQSRLSASFLRGLALFGNGELEPAAAQFRASMRLSPDFLPAAFYLGACYAAGGHDREAVGAWQTALITEADARIVYDVLADALLRLREGEQATSILTEAREKWADDDSLVPRLAVSQVLLDRGREALALIEPYIERHGTDVDAIFLAIRLMYDVHSAGGQIKTPAEDAAAARKYATLYAAAGGANAPLVNRWVQFIARTR